MKSSPMLGALQLSVGCIEVLYVLIPTILLLFAKSALVLHRQSSLKQGSEAEHSSVVKCTVQQYQSNGAAEEDAPNAAGGNSC